MLHDYEVLRRTIPSPASSPSPASPFEGQKNFEGAQYIQDHWTPRDNLTVEAGLRAEWNEIVRDLELAPAISPSPGRRTP